MKKIISKFWNWVLGKTTIDEKVVAAAKEVKRRADLVNQEVKDVKKALKQVGKQIGDVADAAEGKPRKGRKKSVK
jgi:hypothetical protein